MFGRPEWFKYRSTGWGIAPDTWQGWTYLAVFAAVFIALMTFHVSESVRQILAGFLAALLVADSAAIWVLLGKHQDERTRLHQLIIERNCSFAAVLSVVAVIGYRIFHNRTDTFLFDPLLLGVLGVMVLTKLISTIYLRFKM